tara:strand:+ start:474 stop:779 length:306 start_codon:yes stop_codon:yes gene_type:complete
MKRLFYFSLVFIIPITVLLLDYIVFFQPDRRFIATAVLLVIANILAVGVALLGFSTMPKIKKGKFRMERVPAISLGFIYPTKKDKMLGIVLPFTALTYTWK